MSHSMVLHFAPETCARVTLTALEETGAPFETRLVAFMAGGHRKPEFLARNPAGKVPVLEVGDISLSQNSAILPYLARLFPEAGLLPRSADPLADALVQEKLSWFAADVHPLVTRIRMPQLICDLPEGTARVRELASDAMRFQLARTEQALADTQWFLGERWSILDAYLAWVWFRIEGAGFDAAPFPNIAAHCKRVIERPASQRALAREEAASRELADAGLAVPLS